MTTPSIPLGGRYLYTSAIDAGTKAPTWLARDRRTGKTVVAAAVEAARVPSYEALVGLVHDHLAAILEVIAEPEAGSTPSETPSGAAVVVAEHVAGKTLHEALSTGRCTPAEAVAIVLPVCRAVDALHARGGIHGAISPRSVVLEPAGLRSGPVLTHLVSSTRGPYCAPERLQGRGWSAADDAWAVHALLFAALTGRLPFAGHTKDELIQSIASGHMQKLGGLGVNEPGLSALIEAGLVAHVARRQSSVAELVRALEGWQPPPSAAPAPERPVPASDERNPFDDEEDATMIMGQPLIPDVRSALTPSEPPPPRVPPIPAVPVSPPAAAVVPEPAPAPIAVAPPSPAPYELAAPAPRRRSAGLVIAALVLAAVAAAAIAVVALRRPPPHGPAPAASPAATAAAPAGASASTAPARAPAASASPEARAAPAATPEERSRCVAAHFEEGTFKGGEDMGFLCDDRDFRGVNSLLHRRLVVAGAGKVTPGMREWSTFGWFELAATAVVRSGCCAPGTPAPSLPQTVGSCSQLTTVLGDIGKQPLAREDAPRRAAAYDEAVTCLFRNGIPRPYNYMARPTSQARRAFQAFFERAAARGGK